MKQTADELAATYGDFAIAAAKAALQATPFTESDRIDFWTSVWATIATHGTIFEVGRPSSR